MQSEKVLNDDVHEYQNIKRDGIEIKKPQNNNCGFRAVYPLSYSYVDHDSSL